jgi:hypothetical protein
LALFRDFSQIMLAFSIRTHARRPWPSILRARADQTNLQGAGVTGDFNHHQQLQC